VGAPDELIEALREQGAGELVIVSNNAGNGRTGLAGLIADGRVRKVICSYPRSTDSTAFHFRSIFGGCHSENRTSLNASTGLHACRPEACVKPACVALISASVPASKVETEVRRMTWAPPRTGLSST